MKWPPWPSKRWRNRDLHCLLEGAPADLEVLLAELWATAYPPNMPPIRHVVLGKSLVARCLVQCLLKSAHDHAVIPIQLAFSAISPARLLSLHKLNQLCISLKSQTIRFDLESESLVLMHSRKTCPLKCGRTYCEEPNHAKSKGSSAMADSIDGPLSRTRHQVSFHSLRTCAHSTQIRQQHIYVIHPQSTSGRFVAMVTFADTGTFRLP